MKRFDLLKSLFALDKSRLARIKRNPSLFSPQLHTISSKQFSNQKEKPSIPRWSTLPKNEQAFDQSIPVHLIKKEQAEKLLEEKARKLNLKVLRREIFNDFVQLSLKYFAWKSASLHNAPTYLAELKRTSIDFVNHIVLFTINSLPITPTAKYPYGREKIKNMAVLIPASLFLYSGCTTIYSAYIQFMYNPTILAEAHDASITSVLLYICSLAVEISIIAKNILDSTAGASTKNISLFDRLKTLFTKKDPLLQVILYENAITLTSSSIPLFCSAVGIFYPIPWLDTLGSFAIGLLQVYAVYQLGEHNFPVLLGEGVDDETLKGIMIILESNEYVNNVCNVRTSLIGSDKFKLVAEISYDIDKITKLVLEDYRDLIDQTTYLHESEDRQESIETALTSLPKRFMKEIQIQNNVIEELIMHNYPNCVHIDLEINHNQLVHHSDEIEKVKNLSILELEKYPLKHDPWIEDAINKILGQNYEQKMQFWKSRDGQHLDKPDPSFINYSMDLDMDYIEELLVVDEDVRFEILKNNLEEKNPNKTENSEDI